VHGQAVDEPTGRSYPDWPFVSGLAVRIRTGRSYPDWPFVSGLAIRIKIAGAGAYTQAGLSNMPILLMVLQES